MQNDFSTIKGSSIYFPKLHVIRAKEKNRINYFLFRNNNYHLNCNANISDEKIKTFKTFYFNINSLKLSTCKNTTRKPLNMNRHGINSPQQKTVISTYTDREFYKVKKLNINKTLDKNRLNKIYNNFIKKKNNSKLKNQGIATSDSIFKKNQYKICYNNLSLGQNENNMDNLSYLNNQTMKEFLRSKTDRLSKKKISLKEVPIKTQRDKYAYIYMSDQSELIKFWRRTNYNPLKV